MPHTIHLPLPPSWEHTAYIHQAHTPAGTVHRLIQITEATTGPSPLDDIVTTRDLELFGLTDWPTAEAARQAAQDAALTIRARADLFDHIAYLRHRARQIHAALATAAEKATASPRHSTHRAEHPSYLHRPPPPTCPHTPPKLPRWPLPGIDPATLAETEAYTSALIAP